MFAKSLSKTLTAGVLSATLALTAVAPTTASAQISDEDALAGIVTLLFLGAAIHNSRNNNDPAPATTTRSQRNDNWRVLPRNCRSDITRRNGNTIRMFTQRCLNNNYRHVNRLPQECHVRVRTDTGQRRQGFRARCLQNQGFRTTRR